MNVLIKLSWALPKNTIIFELFFSVGENPLFGYAYIFKFGFSSDIIVLPLMIFVSASLALPP